VRVARALGAGTVLGIFGWLNIHNWCQPGWCGRFGVPVTFYKYTDQIAEFNGKLLNEPSFSLVALMIDLVVAVAIAWGVWLALGRIPRKYEAA